MLESSKDILYIVIAFCVLWITVFLCWMFFYVAKLLRSMNQVVDEFRSRLQLLTEALSFIRGKVENIHSLLNVAGAGVAGVVKNAVSKKAKEWLNRGTSKMNTAAKDAVDRAVEATAKKMGSVAKKLKK